MPLVVASLCLRRGRIAHFLRTQGRVGLIAGLISALGYAIVIWAMSRSAMALVASLRETSVIFGALIGAVLLGEPFGRRRVLAAAVVAAGVMMLSLTA
jgi:drug/metabolite transporter (DMT)-like permease